MRPVDPQPFDRFSEDAKRVFELTQKEAENAGHTYIGTEHLLLGILVDGQNVGARALREMGVSLEAVRTTLTSVSGRPEDKLDGQLRPTPRTRKVIETAFQQARAMGHSYMGPEHLVLGLVVESEGIAALMLRDMGVTPGRTWAAVTRLLAEPGVVARQEATVVAGEPEGMHAVFSPEATAALDRARELADKEGAPAIQMEHLLRALTER
jgi:ATP-dependent Clp protease ATP-binding subunit ClpC